MNRRGRRGPQSGTQRGSSGLGDRNRLDSIQGGFHVRYGCAFVKLAPVEHRRAMSSAPFDKDALLDRVDGDAEFLAESVELLEEDGPPLLGEIRDAASAGDAERVAKAAHAFKGLVLNFCADAAAEAARRVEVMGREGATDGLDAAVSALAAEADLLMKSLRAYIGDLPA